MNREIISSFAGKTIHILGISGAEGSTVASFLIRQGFTNLVGHDSCSTNEFKESFLRFHDWMSEEEKEVAFEKLISSSIEFRFQDRYLEGVVSGQWSVVSTEEEKNVDQSSIINHQSSIIFVPQSWFRYAINDPLKKYFEADLKVKTEYRDRIWSMTKLYLELFPGKTIGVTGSNGKSTTTAMIGGMLKQATSDKRQAISTYKDDAPLNAKRLTLNATRLFWGGNDRKNDQPLDRIEEATENDILLLEISNRQLSLGLGKSPNIAVLTNVVPNHLDDHGTFESYVSVKEEILRYQRSSKSVVEDPLGGIQFPPRSGIGGGLLDDIAVLNWNNEPSKNASRLAKGNVFFFDLNIENKPVSEGFLGTRREQNDLVFYSEKGREVIASVSDISIPGEHNIENALAAIAAVQSLQIPPSAIREALRNFQSLDHRIQLVAEKDGVKYINDSSGCSPLNIVMAVNALLQPSPGLAALGHPLPFHGRGEETFLLPPKREKVPEGRMRVLLERAKKMRSEPTEVERKLWSMLRDRQLEGYKFRRQKPIGQYIVDFVCLEKKVIVEADGSQHAEEKDEQYDLKRSAFFETQGYRVLRFWNNEILENDEGVWEAIFNALENGPLSQSLILPSPFEGEEGARSTLAHEMGEGDRRQGEGSLILIAGGYRRNPTPGEFLPVAEKVKDPRIKHIFLIGSVQEIFEKELIEGGVDRQKITRCENLKSAFDQAKALSITGDTIALTPGCESFGEFRDYRERGERFAGLTLSL